MTYNKWTILIMVLTERPQDTQTKKMALFSLMLSAFIMLIKKTMACPSACFCDANFQYISCVGDGVHAVPPDISKLVIRLEIRNYAILSLSSEDLEGLIHLQELKLQQTQIHTINNDTFLNLHTLEYLDLSQNMLVNLNMGPFAGLLALHYLDISSNLLISLDNAFEDLSLVEQLNLRANQIPRLTVKSLAGLQKLQYLNLELNNISTIEMGAFQYLTNLAHLILSNNPLSTLSRLDFFGSRLQYIDISNTGIQNVPQTLAQFVRDLRLAKNNITYIRTGDLESYHYLGLLVLDDNNITEIEDDALGRLEFLNRLWLNGNKLSSIPANLPSCLRSLYIEENKLKAILSFSFQGLFNLEHLYLQRNQIEYLDKRAFCDLLNLRSLDLQANKIKNLSAGVFEKLLQLETLDLSQNEIKIMGVRCFDGLDNLRTLQISRISSTVNFHEMVFDTLKNLYNLELYDSSSVSRQILNSTQTLHSLHNLRELNIMHNGLVSLRSDFPTFFPNLKVIKISGNKWHCNQSILWLQKWIITSNIQFYQSYDVRCASPLQLQFKPVMLLTKQDFVIIKKETFSSKEKIETNSQKKVSEKPYLRTKFPSNTIKPSELFLPVHSTMISVKLNRNQSNIRMASFKLTALSNSEVHKTTTIPYYKRFNQSYNHLVMPNYFTPSLKPNETFVLPFNYAADNTLNTTNVQTETTNITTKATENYREYENILNSNYFSKSSPVQDIVKSSNYKTKIPNTTESPYNSTELQELSLTQTKQHKSPAVNIHAEVHEKSRHPTTTLTVYFSLFGICLLVIFGILGLATYRCQKISCGAAECQVRRNSSISYSPQRDEVSILTVSEDNVKVKRSSQNEMRNKLYYIMDSNNVYHDPSKEALPDPQFQQLLPHTLDKNGHALS
ncbi:uncharacterized protein LOC143232719 [Tachypleus tridentatus]|uniref:uncharacterized protein LOC143232719 n=1 Tax=Tachypleus tridentatus TaxID=6853 RepID=UPI003FD1D5CD